MPGRKHAGIDRVVLAIRRFTIVRSATRQAPRALCRSISSTSLALLRQQVH